jgi:hypothetical protein
MKTEKYALRVIAPDGEYKTEGFFETIEAAWSRAEDMGSRWYFYPVCIVTGAARTNKARIVAVPVGLPAEWIGRTVKHLAETFAADAEHVCDYCNGKSPLCLFP